MSRLKKTTEETVLSIHGYVLREPLTNAHAGFAKWGFARKNGKEYFIKEFMNPVYPTDDSPYEQETKELMRKACDVYIQKQIRLYEGVNSASNGNLVRVEEFFRYGGRFYIVTQRIAPSTITMEELVKQDILPRLRLCLVLSHTLMKLHDKKIVHADLKPDNILLTETEYGQVTAKIIDIDTSFFEDDPPDEITGDQVYFAPEAALYMLGAVDGDMLSCKMDVFSLGLIFHQILCGSLPEFSSEYHYPFQACLNDECLKLSSGLKPELSAVIGKMLEQDAYLRCSMREVFEELQSYIKEQYYSADAIVEEVEKYTPETEHKSDAGSVGRLRLNIKSSSEASPQMQSDAFYKPQSFE